MVPEDVGVLGCLDPLQLVGFDDFNLGLPQLVVDLATDVILGLD